MKKSKLLIVTLIMMMIFTVLSFNSKIFATEVDETNVNAVENEEETITNDQEETSTSNIEVHRGDLYVLFSEDDYSATSYVMDKYVSGNAFIFGQDVTITGEVDGSVFVFASNLTLGEDVYISGQLYAFADTIKMEGFAYDMYAACENFEMTTTGMVYRDFKLAANDVKFYGQVGRDVDMTASNIEIYDDGEKETYVGGNFRYTADKRIENEEGIMMRSGEITFTQATHEEVSVGKTGSDYVLGAIKSALIVLVVYALLIFMAPKFIEKSKEYVSTRALLSAAIGLAVVILVPVVALILLFTVIGIPISLMLLVLYVLLLAIGNSISAIAINEFIVSKVPTLKETWKKVLLIIPVAIVIYLIRQIPVIGGWITTILLFIGVGISILYQFDKRKKNVASAE